MERRQKKKKKKKQHPTRQSGAETEGGRGEGG